MKYLLIIIGVIVILAYINLNKAVDPITESIRKLSDPNKEGSAESVTEMPEPPTAKSPAIDIHDAAYDGKIEAVKQHLAAGVDVNVVNNSKETPLHWAAIEGQEEIVELLIAKGANVNAKADERNTPLHTAALNNREEVAELLIAKGVDVNAKDVNGETPLDWADDEIADLLRKHGGKTGEELEAEGK